MKKILFVILTLATALTTCKNGGDKRDYDQMAKDLCTCRRPLAEINNQIKDLVAAGKTEEVAALFVKVETIAKEGEECISSLELKYGVVEGESEKKVTTALEKHCADIAAMLAQRKEVAQ